jgi:microcystin-dependent protein
LDRDNINANPPSAKTFALRAPIGDTNTSDLKKSITRETIDKLSTTLRVGQTIQTVSASTSSASLTFDRRHGLGSIATGTLYTPNANYNPGTYYDVKLLNTDANPAVGTWKGATAKVVVESGGNVSSVTIISGGSGYTNNEVLYLDSSRVGSGINATYTISTAGISTSIGDVVQVTGVGTVTDGYYRIIGINSETQISVAKTAGDPTPIAGQYAFIVGPSSRITTSPYISATGITTFTTATPHGLLKGNKFRVIDSSNNNLGDYVVEERVGVTSFTAITSKSLSATNGYILKHGFSANEAISDIREENFGIRQVSLYDNEITSLSTAITDDAAATTLDISSINSGIGTAARFSLGSYIQIDNEIMRITTSNNNTQFDVIRGALGTRKEAHDAGSLIRKINPIAVEFRRPSILRASGHTFEYLGYGPGNYSTGLPQVQVKSLTEREDFLVQSQERAGGIVVYTGMNNSGDFFTGNTKTSSSSGEVTSYDIPRPTVTGEDPSKSSVVYDEVTVKERLLVEGGDSGTVLSQFDGPVTFNKQIRSKDTSTFSGQVRVTNATSSDSTGKGALTVKGGVGVGENLNVGGNISVEGVIDVDNLRLDGNTLSSTNTNGDVNLSPNGSGNVVISGDLRINGNDIKSSTNTTAITLSGSNVTIAGDLEVNGNDIKASDGNTNITLTSNTLTTLAGDLRINGNDIKSSTNATAISLSGDNVDVIGDLTADSMAINTSGIGQGDLGSNGGSDGIFGIINTSSSGKTYIVVENASGTARNSVQVSYDDVKIVGNLDLTTSPASSGRISANYLDVPNISPIGSIMMWPGPLSGPYTWPSSWAMCNGDELLRASYTDLYRVLTNGNTTWPFGANTNGSGGPGNTHFRLPDLRERFVVGAGGGSAYNVGNTGGAATVKLEINEIPSHNHNFNDPGHNHGITEPNSGQGHKHTSVNSDIARNTGGYGSGSGGGGLGPNSIEMNFATTEISINNNGTNITFNAQGGGQAHENRPPYFGLIYIIRIR